MLGLDVQRAREPVPPLLGARAWMRRRLGLALGDRPLFRSRDVLGSRRLHEPVLGFLLPGDLVVVDFEHPARRRPLVRRAVRVARRHLHMLADLGRHRLFARVGKRPLARDLFVVGLGFRGGGFALGLLPGAALGRSVHRRADSLRHRRAAPGDFADFSCAARRRR